jgi:retron-type reverse transcriptase
MNLTNKSLEWALDFIESQSDSDLFPKILELDALTKNGKRNEFISLIEGKDLNLFHPGACRRFIVPKDEISYRQATQLDPQDSIILTSLIYQFGAGIEKRRLSPEIVFSYRFHPTKKNGLYRNTSAWTNFWKKANLLSKTSSNILYCDIADFYNQIYHHTIENQLTESGFSNQATKWIISLLGSTTAGVSRGIPVGPHAIHLLAEASLIPIDNNFQSIGINFIRYADDIIIFGNSKKEVNSALSKVALILDKHQRIMLQRHKTRFFEMEEFEKYSLDMISDRPINKDEEDLISITEKYSHGDPYKTISNTRVSSEDWEKLSEISMQNIIVTYLNKSEVDYSRLRWLYRRLAQIGHPGAIEVTLDNIDRLGPCIANVCFYLSSIQNIEPQIWRSLGNKLLQLLETEEVKQNEYFRILILSLFSRNSYIDNFSHLSKLYQGSDPSVRREILLTAKVNKAYDWIKLWKEDFQFMDPWQQTAYLYCVSGFPKDEKKFFLTRQEFNRPFEKTLSSWSKSYDS